jgi:integrase
MARKPKLPPGARSTGGGITLQIPDVNDGGRRKSQNKIDGREPRSYATPDEAWAGYLRVKAFMAERQHAGQTLRGFWLEWSDPDHPYWGTLGKRSEQSVLSYKTRTRRFVDMYGERLMHTITEDDVIAYLSAGGVHSSLRAIATMFHDAQSRGLVTAHPAQTVAARSEALMRRRRAALSGVVPSEDQINAMLERARGEAYPRTLYGWLLTGVRTGMRGGEIDGMEWDQLKGNRYEIRLQFNAALRKMAEPKHGSRRSLLLPSDVMAEIERQRERADGSPFIWSSERGYRNWTHDGRDHWWTWASDGGPSLRQLVGGVTMYRATRHYWASWALNVAGLSPYQAALLYGHSDGGKLLTETYAKPDHERAMQAALEAFEATLKQPTDIASKRRSA